MYFTLQEVTNKGADQTAQMPRLISALVGSHATKSGFLALWPIYIWAIKADRNSVKYIYVEA